MALETSYLIINVRSLKPTQKKAKIMYNLLDLFAGSRAMSKVGLELDMRVFSSDLYGWDNIDYQVDILDFDVNKVPFIPDIITASPPCNFFSIASIGYHWHKNNLPKSEGAKLGLKLVAKTLEIIDYYLTLNPDLLFYIENPTGKLRKLDFNRSLDRTSLWQCQYGNIVAKPTDIWTNNLKSMFNPLGWKPRPICFKNNPKCNHLRSPRHIKGQWTEDKGLQGIRGKNKKHTRAILPAQLCKEILNCSLNKLNHAKDKVFL